MVGVLWRLEGGNFRFCVPSVSNFVVVDGSVTVVPSPGSASDAISLIADDTPRTAAYFQLWDVALHAAAVAPPAPTPACAVLLCGASWPGKFAVAAALAERGWDVLEDDLVPVTLGAAGLPVLAERSEVLIRSAVALRLSGGSEPSLSRATGGKECDLLTRSVCQRHVADALLEPAAFARTMAALATLVEVWHMVRPHGVVCVEGMADLVTGVARAWDSAGGAGVDLTCDDA